MSAGDPSRDVRVPVAHAAPVLLHPRRGAGPAIAFAPLVTPARIRHVHPEALAERRFPRGEYGHGEGDPAGLALFEGRLWRRLPVRGWNEHSMPVQAGGIAGLLRHAGLADRWPLWDLHLDPILPVGTTLRMDPPDIAPRAPGSVLLDLSGETAAAVARRLGERLLHDGTQAWYALRPPVIAPGFDHEAVAWIVPQVMQYTYVCTTGTSPEGLDAYRPYAQRRIRADYHRGRLGASMLAAAARLREDTAGMAYDPLADVAPQIRHRLFSIAAYAQAAARRSAAAAEAAAPHLAGLVPLVAMASVDLVEGPRLSEAADRIAALARAVLASRPAGTPHTSNTANLADHLDYVETVARPRLDAIAPSPAEEAGYLGGLAP